MNLGLSVFEAFPNALIRGIYQIGKCQRGTLEGNRFVKIRDLDVLVDMGDYSDINNAPNAAELMSDMLLYCKPEQLPTIYSKKLCSTYMIYDSQNDDYFQIVRANWGKNQNTGELEHVELELVQTELAV